MSGPSARLRGNCLDDRCISREILDHVFSRWGGLVLFALDGETLRYSELRGRIRGISEKMLAQTLRTLERDGFIERRSYPVVPPHVEYRLSPLGRQCAAQVSNVLEWIERHYTHVLKAHADYDAS